MEQLYTYVDGEYYKEQDAKISVFDHVIHYGDGVFDTCSAINGVIFKLNQHVDRIYRSAHAVRIAIPLAKEEFKDAIIETVRRCKLKNAFIKPIVTRGAGPEPLLDYRNCKPSVIIIVRPYLFLVDREKFKTGVNWKTSSIRRIPDQCLESKIKSCNYLNLVLMRMEAYDSGADDAVALTVDGYVAETAGTNIFIIKDRIISTPSENILLGITRETVIEIANNMGIMVKQSPRLTLYDLYNADEVFFSSTAGGMIPVVKVDSRIIGSGMPGNISLQIQEAYEKMLKEGVHGTSIF